LDSAAQAIPVSDRQNHVGAEARSCVQRELVPGQLIPSTFGVTFMHKLLLGLFATVFISAVAAADGAATPPPVAEGDIPSGYAWLSGGSIAIGIGYTWGHGTLYYSKYQKQYKFKLSGISVADVGGAGITAEGEVYNLTNPADLTGDYSAVTAGITVIEGGSVAYLKNDKGVVIKLHSQTGGLRFNLSANGLHITLQQM
jgi:hypothetical protein